MSNQYVSQGDSTKYTSVISFVDQVKAFKH
jgi:hypothetical protein